jgi:hypothetical protein
MLMSRLLEAIYRRQSQGPKNLENEGRNGKMHVLKGGCGLKNSKP